jgi:hypothetical protein
MSCFTACKRTKKWRGSRHFRQNSRPFSCPYFHLPLLGSLASLQTLGASCGESWNALKSLVLLQVGGLTCRWQRHSIKPSCWECSTIVEQAETQTKGCSADWRRSRSTRVLEYFDNSNYRMNRKINPMCKFNLLKLLKSVSNATLSTHLFKFQITFVVISTISLDTHKLYLSPTKCYLCAPYDILNKQQLYL